MATEDTRQRLLEAAGRRFAADGYRGATVAAICEDAGANVAAVNYHFGSKEELYRQAWRTALEDMLQRMPIDGGVDPNETPEARLRGRIYAGLCRAVLGDGIEFAIMRKEMANPTGLLQEVIEEAIAPLRKYTQGIIRELLGSAATDRDIELCEWCVIGPLHQMIHHREGRKHRGLAPVFDPSELEAMVDRVTAYALGGIREIRREIDRGTPGTRARRKKGTAAD